MIRETIHIRNFGPLKDVRIDDVKPFTLFIGESASGKSTLLKVMALFRYLYKMLNVRAYLKHAHIAKSPFRFRIDRMLRENALAEYLQPDTQIVYTVHINGRAHTLEYVDRKLVIAPVMPKEDMVFFKGAFVSENRNMIPTWAGKVATNRGATLGFYFHETYNDFDAATEVLKVVDLGVLDLKMEVRRGNNKAKRFVVVPSDGKYTPLDLRYASSGIQTAAPLVVVAKYFACGFSFKEAFRRSVLDYLYEEDRLANFRPDVELGDLPKYVHIHVEEPELSLYPDAQVRLLNTLVRTVFQDRLEDRQLGLMMATHSPYLINQVNVLLKAGKHREQYPDVPGLDAGEVAVYKLAGGKLQLLNARDVYSGDEVVNTIDLSEAMDRIYENYMRVK